MIRVDKFQSQPKCPVCGDAARRDLGRIAYGASPIELSSERIDVPGLDAHLLECVNCGARRTDPIVPPGIACAVYESASAGRWSGDSDRFESILRKAKLEIPARRGRVLDYGCYTGGLLDCFAARGWETFGVDLCRAAVDVATGRGHRVVAGGQEALAALAGCFDVVTLFDVMEHLTEPRTLLTRLRELIAPGGELWILTGDAGSLPSRIFRSRWWYVSFCEHVVFYRLENLERVLNQSGYRLSSAARIRHLDHGPLHRAKNYLTTSAYQVLHPLLAGRTRHRFGVGPPPLFPATDHVLIRASKG